MRVITPVIARAGDKLTNVVNSPLDTTLVVRVAIYTSPATIVTINNVRHVRHRRIDARLFVTNGWRIRVGRLDCAADRWQQRRRPIS